MTLVVAAGLSDRVVLAADTRATTPDGFDDNALKVQVLNENIVVGCAGNLAFIQHVLRRVVSEMQADWGIDDFRHEVVEIIKPACLECIEDHGSDPRARTMGGRFVFAGRQLGSPPQFDVRALLELQSARERRREAVVAQRLAGMQSGVPVEMLPGEFQFMLTPTQHSATLQHHLFGLPTGTAFVSRVRTGFFAVGANRAMFEVHDGRAFTMLRRGNGHGGPAHSEAFVEELEFGAPRAHGWNAVSPMLHAEIFERFNQFVGGCVTVFMVDDAGVATVMADEVKRLRPDGVEEVLPRADIVEGVLHRVMPDGTATRLRPMNLTDADQALRYELCDGHGDR